MISNQSLRAPGLASFCFLTTSKSEKETIFLIVIIVARVGASLSLSLSLSLSPLPGRVQVSCRGCNWPRPPGPAQCPPTGARQGPRQGCEPEWGKDGAKTKTGRLSWGAWSGALGKGRGRPVGGGGRLQRETIGSPEPRRRWESVWDGRQDRMVVTQRTLETFCWSDSAD